MAGFAVDFGDVIGMGVLLDVSVAVAALEAAMDAGAELVAIDGDAVACGVLHGFVGVAGEAIRLGCNAHRGQAKYRCNQAEYGQAMMAESPQVIYQALNWSDKHCKKESSDTRGSGHALVFPSRRVSNGYGAHGSPHGGMSAQTKFSWGSQFRGDSFWDSAGSDSGHNCI